MKTTVASPGNTDWDSVDGSIMVNRLGHPDQNLIASVWAFEHNSDIYVATQQDYGRVALHIFDPGTSLWTTRDDGALGLGADGYNPNDSTLTVFVSLSVRSDGDAIIFFHDPAPIGSGNADNCIIMREAGTWGTKVTVLNNSLSPGILLPPAASDRICKADNQTINGVYVNNFLSNNTLAVQSSNDATPHSNDFVLGAGGIDSSDNCYIPYIDSGGTVVVIDFTNDVDNIAGEVTTTVTSNLVDTSTDGPLKLGLVLDGTVVHLFYIEATSDDIYHDDNDGGWGTDTSEITGTGAIGALSANKLTTDIGIIYDDAGTAKFAVYELAAAATIVFKPFNYNNFLVR